MDFKKWVKSIQTAGYNGARTVVRFMRLSDKNSDLSKTTTTTTESGFSSLKPAMSRVTTNHHHFFHTSTYCSLFSKVWIDIVQSYFRFVFCTSKNNELFLSSIDLSSTKICTKSSSCTFLFTKILLTKVLDILFITLWVFIIYLVNYESTS